MVKKVFQTENLEIEFFPSKISSNDSAIFGQNSEKIKRSKNFGRNFFVRNLFRMFQNVIKPKISELRVFSRVNFSWDCHFLAKTAKISKNDKVKKIVENFFGQDRFRMFGIVFQTENLEIENLFPCKISFLGLPLFGQNSEKIKKSKIFDRKMFAVVTDSKCFKKEF